jgi:ubiquitin-protein ligase
MSSSAIKRIIQKDIKSIHIHNLNDMGIFIEFNQENMLEAVAMIIGPEDSVYSNGVLFFKIKFPSNYPYSPPIVNYISRGSIRIHPNLYTGSAKDNYLGKVCISILGTWSGPQWTTIMDISSVLISIQSLLDNNPLENEPGFAGKQTENHIKYKQSIIYEKFRTLIIKNIFDIPEEFICFKDQILNHFKNKKDKILSELDEYINNNNKVIIIPIYRINLKLNYEYLKNKILEGSEKIKI